MLFSSYLCKYELRCVEIISLQFRFKCAGTFYNLCDCSWPAWTLSLSNADGGKSQPTFNHKRLHLLLIVQNSSMTIKHPAFFISEYTFDSFCLFWQVIADFLSMIDGVFYICKSRTFPVQNIVLSPHKFNHLVCVAASCFILDNPVNLPGKKFLLFERYFSQGVFQIIIIIKKNLKAFP